MVNIREPGLRNQRVAVERNTRPPAGDGQLGNSWGLYCKRWGSVSQVSGSESFKGHQLQADVTHIVFLPSDAETRLITVKDRLTVKGKTLNILSVYDVELSGIEVAVQCKETV